MGMNFAGSVGRMLSKATLVAVPLGRLLRRLLELLFSKGMKMLGGYGASSWIVELFPICRLLTRCRIAAEYRSWKSAAGLDSFLT